MVPNGNGAIDVEFQESFKDLSLDQKTIFSQPKEISSIKMRLYDEQSYALNDSSRDAIKIKFSDNYSNIIDAKDVFKLENVDENLATIHQGKLLTIEQRSLPSSGDVLPLFVDHYRTTDYVFTLDLDGFDPDMNVFLEDQYTNEHNLLTVGEQNEIYFSVNSNVNASKAFNRFNIVFSNTTLSNDEVFKKEDLRVYPNPVERDLQVILSNLYEGEVELQIFDILGKKMYQETMRSNAGKLSINNLNFNAGTYILRVTDEEANTFTQKVIKR